VKRLRPMVDIRGVGFACWSALRPSCDRCPSCLLIRSGRCGHRPSNYRPSRPVPLGGASSTTVFPLSVRLSMPTNTNGSISNRLITSSGSANVTFRRLSWGALGQSPLRCRVPLLRWPVRHRIGRYRGPEDLSIRSSDKPDQAPYSIRHPATALRITHHASRVT